MSEMSVALRVYGKQDVIFDVDSIMVTVTEGDTSRRYRIKPHDLSIRVSIDGELIIRPVSSNLIEIEEGGWAMVQATSEEER